MANLVFSRRKIDRRGGCMVQRARIFHSTVPLVYKYFLPTYESRNAADRKFGHPSSRTHIHTRTLRARAPAVNQIKMLKRHLQMFNEVECVSIG